MSGTREIGIRTGLLICLLSCGTAMAQGNFVNWETPQLHPIELTPDGQYLLALNTADDRLEVFSIRTDNGTLQPTGSVFVGIDPTSVRCRTATEIWVVNQISDTISIVDLPTLRVRHTLNTQDEPCDVVFAGTPERAFVSCAQASKLMVFDPANLSTAATVLDIEAEETRALATNPEKTKVYLASFESGNRTTVIGAAGAVNSVAGNAVLDRNGPYGGAMPPPNRGTEIYPPISAELGGLHAPPVGLIVQRSSAGRWMDDNNGDWTYYVADGGTHSRRVAGWQLIDNDVAVIDANALSISYLTDMMQACMNLAVQPGTGNIAVVGTQATNVIRYEPNLKSRFVRVELALGNQATPSTPQVVDLNPHLDYSDEQVAEQANPETASQSLRDLSIGDPRFILWNAAGSRAYIAGMGSNNVVIVDGSGLRVADPINVAEGPTGLALNEANGKLYVLSRFAAKIDVIDTASNLIVAEHGFYDPTPAAVKTGRKHLYDTHKNSGLGQLSCASCHPDGRTDRLGWDLGNPAGSMSVMDQLCRAGVAIVNPERDCPDFHPMKGVMVTQTLQDIIGHEPFHWRGDKNGLEEFNEVFMTLLGDDTVLSTQEMQEFEDFLSTLYFPPNPFRNLDNSLPRSLPLPGHYTNGEFSGTKLGDPLPPGDAVKGLFTFRTEAAHSSNGVTDRTCVSCHTLPTGLGTSHVFMGDSALFPNAGSGSYVPGTPGPNGEIFHTVVGLPFDYGDLPLTVKVVQLRDLYRKNGFVREIAKSRAGFGVFHNGSETLAGFMEQFQKFPNTLQDLSDLIAFLMSFSGSDLPVGNDEWLLEPPGPLSKDTHAAVGKQITFDTSNRQDVTAIGFLTSFQNFADNGKVGLIAKGRRNGENRGWVYVGAGQYQSDRTGETIGTVTLRTGAADGSEITFTVVPKGTETRLGIDRDLDGVLDGEEAPIQDCNANAIPDEMDISHGTSSDCDGNSVPDECEGPKLAIDDQPATDMNLCEGHSFEVSVAASGATEVTYQWRKDGEPIEGATSATFLIAAVATTDAGVYDAVVTNSCATRYSTNSVLTVTALPTADAGSDQEVCLGGSATLAGAATSAAGVLWTTAGDGTFDDATSPTAVYTAGPADEAAGSVSLTLTADPLAPCAEPAADSLTLTIAQAAVVDAGSDMSICNGAATLSATLGNAANPIWTTSGDGTFDDATSLTAIYTPGAQDIADGAATLTLAAESSGACGGVVSDSLLVTFGAMNVTVDAGADQLICGGDVALAGSAHSGVNLLWSTTGDGVFADATSAVTTYTPGANDALVGKVTLTLSADSAGPCTGTMSDSLTVTIGAGAQIQRQPVDVDAALGGEAAFSIEATGSEPLTYQWRKDGLDLVDGDRISGAQSAELTITAVEEGDAAAYNCVVTGSCGSATSDSASLRLTTPGCPNAQLGCNVADIYPENGDCVIDLHDLGIVLTNYAPTVTGRTRAEGDLFPIDGGDGVVNLNDLGVVLAAYGLDCR